MGTRRQCEICGKRFRRNIAETVTQLLTRMAIHQGQHVKNRMK